MKPEIVIYSFFPWRHEYPSTAHGMAHALSSHARVWFVSKPPTWKDVLTGSANGHPREAEVEQVQTAQGGTIMSVTLPATAPINALPFGKTYAAARRWADRQLNRTLKQVLEAHQVGDFHWINVYAPTQFVDLDLHRKPLRRCYYSVDAIEVNAYTRKHGVLAEAEQVKRSDYSLCTSRELARKHEQTLRKQGEKRLNKVQVLPNAMAAELYLDVPLAAEPAELRGIPHPRIGYVGNLDSDRIDYAGLQALALARPNHHFVLIGPWNTDAERRETFATLPNVHLLGRKEQTDCPAYLQHVDLGIIPFALNTLTASIYPLKINEYLALGLPVVSSPFSQDILAFGDLIVLAKAEDWPAAVDTALQQVDDAASESRVACARDNTWQARADQFLALTEMPQAITSVEPL